MHTTFSLNFVFDSPKRPGIKQSMSEVPFTAGDKACFLGIKALENM
jgi:hypothetical protein